MTLDGRCLELGISEEGFYGPSVPTGDMVLVPLDTRRWHSDEARLIKDHWRQNKKRVVFFHPWKYAGISLDTQIDITSDLDLILMCFDARKNVCCSQRVASLLRGCPDHILQKVLLVSHLWWCRFAPNIIITRTGMFLSKILSQSIFLDILSGQISAEYFRFFRGNIFWDCQEWLVEYLRVYAQWVLGWGDVEISLLQSSPVCETYAIIDTLFGRTSEVSYELRDFLIVPECGSPPKYNQRMTFTI